MSSLVEVTAQSLELPNLLRQNVRARVFWPACDGSQIKSRLNASGYRGNRENQANLMEVRWPAIAEIDLPGAQTVAAEVERARRSTAIKADLSNGRRGIRRLQATPSYDDTKEHI
jgi:hypothetical protein